MRTNRGRSKIISASSFRAALLLPVLIVIAGERGLSLTRARFQTTQHRSAPATAIVVNSLGDGAPANDGLCTLREALINANADNQSGSVDCPAGNGADIVSFSPAI